MPIANAILFQSRRPQPRIHTKVGHARLLQPPKYCNATESENYSSEVDTKYLSAKKNGRDGIVFSQELCCTRWLVRNRRTRWEDLALAHPWFSSAHQIVAHLTFSSSSLSSSSLICSANCTSHRHTIITSITSVS